jgi:predicted Zn-dependent peptidase
VMDLYGSITPDDVERVAREYAHPDALATVVVHPTAGADDER